MVLDIGHAFFFQSEERKTKSTQIEQTSVIIKTEKIIIIRL